MDQAEQQTAEPEAGEPLRILSSDDEGEKEILVLWGAAGLEETGASLEFYLALNTAGNSIPKLNYGIFDSDPRCRFSGRLEGHADYCREVTYHYPSDQSYKYGELYSEVEETFKKYILDEDNLQKLKTALNKEQDKQYKDFLTNMPSITVPSGGRFCVRGAALSTTQFEADFSTEKSTGTTVKEPDPEDEELIDATSDIPDTVPEIEALPRIAITTTVVNGTPVSELGEGDEVKFRFVGAMVEKLGAKHIDEKRGDVSIPMTGEIVKINQEPDLPGDITGEAGEYRLFVLRASEEQFARGYLKKSEKVAVQNRKSSQKSKKEGHLQLLPEEYRYILYPVFVVLSLLLGALLFL